MSALQPFVFEDQLVRVIDREGEPWFVGMDVCRALDISKHRDALSRLDTDERGSVVVDSLGGPQETTIISEPGVYRLVFSSRKPEAERFKRWLAHEVLPALRKTGSYAVEREPVELVPGHPSFNEAVRLVAEARRINGPAAALSIWKRLGLPYDPALEPASGGASALDERDPVYRFAHAKIEHAPGVVTPFRLIWRAFADYCQAEGIANPGEIPFGIRFARLGFRKRKSTGRVVYEGIRLSAGEDEASR
ncbi:BRO-N domain-containing protein [Stappia albiluteola]|uniref:BRO-N domain-containing protein n=1 Tax=Stappia albiluteola TaxID=2758565 RepID=UPI001AD8BBB7|nr:Bro-N domain-containing protein [Stappia albiluteola]